MLSFREATSWIRDHDPTGSLTLAVASLVLTIFAVTVLLPLLMRGLHRKNRERPEVLHAIGLALQAPLRVLVFTLGLWLVWHFVQDHLPPRVAAGGLRWDEYSRPACS